MNSKFAGICLIGLGLTALSACQNSSSSSNQVNVDQALKSSSELENYLKRGFIESYHGPVEDGILESVGADDTSTPTADADSGAGNFSTTNLQEAGVDESDMVKFNGQYLYAYKSEPYAYYDAPASIEIYNTQENPISSERIGSLALGNNISHFSGLYLSDEELVTLSQRYIGDDFANHAFAEADYYSPWYWQKRATEIRVYGLDTPASPEQSHQIQFEGDLISSRRIGNTLYLATKFTPDVVIPYGENKSENDWAREVLEMPLTDLLPRYWIDGVQQGHLFEDQECYLPDLAENDGYPSIVALIKIDLDQPSTWQSRCSSGRIDGVYASTNAFFITGNDYRGNTRIDQYRLDDLRLMATGKLPGNLWNSMPSFRMSEKDGMLRILMSDANFWGGISEPLDDIATTDVLDTTPAQSDHRLYVLKANEQQTFDVIAKLPNEQQTARIGKPGEAVKSVRYMEDRAYVVTFRQTDPLYVINLADATAPFIEGELEIEGFSEYLHPIGENLLLGLGKAADADGFEQGLKLSTFDITDPENPTEIKSYQLGERGSYSQALWNHKAMSFMDMGDELRLAFTWSAADDWQWQGNKLHVVDIDKANGDASVVVDHFYQQQADTQNYYSNEGYSRALLHADGIHLVTDGDTESAPLSDWQ